MRRCLSLVELMSVALFVLPTVVLANGAVAAPSVPRGAVPSAAQHVQVPKTPAAKPKPASAASRPAAATSAVKPRPVRAKAAGIEFIADEKASQVLASSILSMSIQNGRGNKADRIGTVNDLIMDEHHKLVGIVVGVGGFLGMGQKNVGIPWSAVENINPEKRVAIVNVTKAELQKAPAFVTTQDQAHILKDQKRQKEIAALAAEAAARHSIFFAYDKAQIAPRFEDVIDNWARYLLADPGVKIQIRGSAGPRGSRGYNAALGTRRAQAVQSALVAQGVPVSRLAVVSLGEQRPACTQSTEACDQQDRRVDLVRQ